MNAHVSQGRDSAGRSAASRFRARDGRNREERLKRPCASVPVPLSTTHGASLPEMSECSAVTRSCLACRARVMAATFGTHSTGRLRMMLKL